MALEASICCRPTLADLRSYFSTVSPMYSGTLSGVFSIS